jgi:hypothetical protein
LAEKITKELNLHEKAIVKCKELEVIEGDLKNPLWILMINNELKITLEVEEYIKIMETLKNVLKENFELKLEKAIMNEFPVDYDDVKAVVLEEMKRNSEASIDEILDKVKLEHPNLFYSIELEKLF